MENQERYHDYMLRKDREANEQRLLNKRWKARNGTYLPTRFWGPSITKTTVSENLRTQLLNLGNQQKENYNHRLAGRIKDEYRYNDQAQSIVENEIIQTVCDSYFDPMVQASSVNDINFQQLINGSSITLTLTSLWINYQVATEYNPLHCHSGDISFVIYLNVPTEIVNEENFTSDSPPGCILFKYGELPRFPDPYSRNKKREAIETMLLPKTEHVIMPSTGDMIIFPSYLTHSVTAFYTPDVTRISVSGNIVIE